MMTLTEGCFDHRDPVNWAHSEGKRFLNEAPGVDRSGNAQDSGALPFEYVGGVAVPIVQYKAADNSSWMCMRDFTRERHCIAVALDGTQEVAKESIRIPDGQYGCTRAVCSRLFEDKFSKGITHLQAEGPKGPERSQH